jgi:hypothetical protein
LHSVGETESFVSSFGIGVSVNMITAPAGSGSADDDSVQCPTTHPLWSWSLLQGEGGTGSTPHEMTATKRGKIVKRFIGYRSTNVDRIATDYQTQHTGTTARAAPEEGDQAKGG